MTTENLTIYFSNGSSASFSISVISQLKDFQNDFLNHIKGANLAGQVRQYEVTQGGRKYFIVVDFAKVALVQIADDGGRPT
jgi:hypothetical protein